jgi:hypothetical protein
LYAAAHVPYRGSPPALTDLIGGQVRVMFDSIPGSIEIHQGWEAAVIRDKLQSRNWPRGQNFSAVAANHGRPAFRVAVPEYYAQSCLSCHGKPKGQIDITNYPKEGGSEGELGGVISITLYH